MADISYYRGGQAQVVLLVATAASPFVEIGSPPMAWDDAERELSALAAQSQDGSVLRRGWLHVHCDVVTALYLRRLEP